jgi:hypothetical protein
MRAKPPISPERRRDRLVGLLIIVLSFGGCMGLSLWGLSKSTPRLAPEPLPPSMERLPGFPKHVDPLKLVERARELSVRVKFRGFVARGVRPDGTIDVSAKKSSVRYSFQSPSGIGYQPLRQGGTLPNRRYCGQQSVLLRADGIGATPDQPNRACPRRAPENLIVPTECSLEDVWKVAQKRRVSKKGTARIEFYESSEGPAFRFKKDRHTFSLLASNCSQVLSASEGRGIVP